MEATGGDGAATMSNERRSRVVRKEQERIENVTTAFTSLSSPGRLLLSCPHPSAELKLGQDKQTTQELRWKRVRTRESKQRSGTG